MRTVNSNNITETFLGYFGKDTDPRVREVMESHGKSRSPSAQFYP